MLCVAILLLLQLLLLAAAVRQRVSGGQIFRRGSLNLTQVFFFSLDTNTFFLMYSLVVCRIFRFDLITYNTYHIIHPRYYGDARSQAGC